MSWKFALVLCALSTLSLEVYAQSVPISLNGRGAVLGWRLRPYPVGGRIGATPAHSPGCDAYQYNQGGLVCDNLPGLTSYPQGDVVTQAGPKNTPPFALQANFLALGNGPARRFPEMHCLGIDLIDLDGENCHFGSGSPMFVGASLEVPVSISIQGGQAQVSPMPGSESLLDGAPARVYFCSPQPIFILTGECRTETNMGGPVALGLSAELTLGIPSNVRIAGPNGAVSPPYCVPQGMVFEDGQMEPGLDFEMR